MASFIRFPGSVTGLLIILAFSLKAEEKVIQSEKQAFRLETIAVGLQNPWGLVQLPDGRLLVTERPGRLRIIENGKLLAEPVANVPAVYVKGQGGLLDIQLHPQYAENGWIYLCFSKPLGDKGLTSVIRARLKENSLTDIETLFEPPVEEATGASVHFGCRITFDNEGFMYFAIGDRGNRNNAQELTNVKGKIHRLHDDGRIPSDNPFVGTAGAKGSIWSYGNRNAQGLVFDRVSNRLWETEHGPKGGDELNLIDKGLNYGWPVITFGINYNGMPITDKTAMPGMEQPVIQWTPSIAACGLDIYHGDKYPNWKGNLFAGALAHRKVVRIELEGDKVTHQELLLENTGRVRDVRALPDGYLYIAYEEPGKIVRLMPVP